MKVLLIPQFSEFGGTRTFFNQLLQLYKKHDFEVTIAINQRQASIIKEQDVAPFKIMILPELNHPLLSKFPISIFADLVKILKVYLVIKPNLVVASLGEPGYLLGLFLLPSKLLYILHTYPFYPNGKLPRMTYFRKAYTTFMLGNRRKILTVSHFAKNEILKYLAAPKKASFIHVVHNTAGEDLNLLMPKKKLNHKKVILTLGHVVWYKDPETWIKVAHNVTSKCEDVEFIWAGEGELLTIFLEKTQKLKISKNVKFMGFAKDVENLFNKADIYFQPSLIESHGFSVLEAMRNGIPSVVSNAGGLPESIENGKNGFVANIEDVETMSQCLLSLVHSASLRESMGAECIKKYSASFSRAAWEKKILLNHH